MGAYGYEPGAGRLDVAADPAYADVLARLREKLMSELKATKDPRVIDGGSYFENPPLARALYKATDVGQEIPAHLYRAVAEILAYIYRIMNGRMPGSSAAPARKG